MKKYTIFLINSLLFCNILFAQNGRLDSLINALGQNSKNDSNKVKTCNAICWEYFITGDFKLAKKYADQSINLSESINFLKGKAEAINYIGNIHAQKAEYHEALVSYNNSLEIKKQIKDLKGMGAAYNNIGNVLWNLGNLPEALKNHLEALKIRETIGNPKNIAQSFANIGNIFLSQRNYDEALKYTLKALVIQKELGDKYALGTTYNNLGTIYDYKKDYAKSLENHLLSKGYKEEVGDKYGMSQSLYNIGLNQIRTKKYEEAHVNLTSSIKLSEELEDNQNISRIYLQFANIEMAAKNYALSKEYSNKALNFALKTNSKEIIRDAYFSQTLLDSTTRNWQGAFFNLSKLIVYKDSLVNEEKSKAIVQQQMQYEFDKKEANTQAEQDKKDAISEKEKQRQKIIINAVSGGLFLVMILVIVIFRNLQTNKKKNLIISRQKEMVEEKQKEILDSIRYAKRIQQSLLPTEKYIDKSLNRLRK